MAFDPMAVGNKLIIVGESQIKTGNKLDHSATELRGLATNLDDNGRIDRALGSVEGGIRSTRNLLTPIAASLHSMATGLSSISIPGIEFDTRTIEIAVIGRVRFVSGISVSSSRPFRTIGQSVESVADDIDSIKAGLKEIADAAKDLQDQLPNLKSRILNTAEDVDQAGGGLVEAGTAVKDAGRLLAS